MYAGGIAGTVQQVTVTGCTADVTIEDTVVSGGVAGCADSCAIEDCSATGGISGLYMLGGMVGGAYDSSVSRCIADVDITGSDWDIGGFVGYVNEYSTIDDSAAFGDVTSTVSETAEAAVEAGGFAGINYGQIDSSYSTGTVTGKSATESAGAFVGCSANGKTVDCFYDKSSNTGLEPIGTTDTELGGGENDIKAVDFTDGSAAYTLNGGSSDGPWFQNIDNGLTPDATPVLDSTHGSVYLVELKDCAGVSYSPAKTTYSNINEYKLDAHVFSDEYAYDSASHWHPCTVCRAADKIVAHTYENETASDILATDATCTEPAYYYVKCDTCDYVNRNKTVAVGEALGHLFEGEYGSDDDEHWGVCSRCKTSGTHSGHVYTISASDKIATEATCTKAATYYVKCDTCGHVSDTKTVSVGNPNGHSWSSEIAGYDSSGHWHSCTVCSAKETAQAHTFKDYTYNNDATYVADGTETGTCTADGCNQTQTRTATGTKLADNTVPTGSVTVGENVWKSFVNNVAFNVFTNDKFSVTIMASDSESGLNTIENLISTTAISESDITKTSGWKTYSPFDITTEGNHIVYARLTDNSGNVAYIGTDGLCVDTIAPKITGVTDEGTYCGQTEFSVTGANIDTVTVAGRPQLPYNGKYTLNPSADAQEIVVTDKAGNSSAVTVTVNDGHTFTNYVSNNDATYLNDGTKTAKCDYCDATETITDEGSAKAKTDVEKFVARLYNLILDREPDGEGFSNFVSLLESGKMTGSEAAHDFIFSNEFINKNMCDEHYITYLYRAILGREPDEAGLDAWLKVLASGETREAVFNGFVESKEFKGFCYTAGIEPGVGMTIPEYGTVPKGDCAICGKEAPVVSFVKRLYTVCLNREASEDDIMDWANTLWDHSNSGTQCAEGFFASDEYTSKQKADGDYVDDLYEAYMGREADPEGKASWVAALQNGDSRESVRDGFAQSEEFKTLCAQYGIIA